MNTQCGVITPDQNGNIRKPVRGTRGPNQWGWWLPHPQFTETFDFVPEDLPQWVRSLKYCMGPGQAKTYLPTPVWIQSPAGIWGWAIRQEEFAHGLWVDGNPWTMHYYVVDWLERGKLIEAAINITIR